MSKPLPENFIRHHDFWFDDGSCVLVSNSDPPVLFRVHRAQLARHSVVFRDMFSLAKPETVGDEGEMLEGCPVVRLQDSPHDVAVLLVALYDGPSFGSNDIDDFRNVAGVLRMATKYVLEPLRNKAIQHLLQAWPVTLEGWEAREGQLRAAQLERNDRFYTPFPHPSLLIDLAHRVDVPALLPSAFYDLSRCSFSQVFEEPHPPSQIAEISLQDTQKLALGKESSYTAVSGMVRAIGPLRKASPTCRTHSICDRDFGELYEAAAQHYLFDPERASDPLWVADELGRLKFSEFSECAVCSAALEKVMGEEREKVWRRIPLWFRLEGWEKDRDRDRDKDR